MFSIIKSDGINVIEKINELKIPIAFTNVRVRIKMFAPSPRKRKGIVPAIVVLVVASNAGIFFLRII